MIVKSTLKDRILEWLIVHNKRVVSSHEIKYDCAMWLMKKYGKEGNLAVERKWRELREVDSNGVVDLVCKEVKTKSKQSTWEIVGFRGVPWDKYLD